MSVPDFTIKPMQKIDIGAGEITHPTYDFEAFIEFVIAILPIRPKTRESYESAFRCHIRGKFEDKSVRDISREDILTILGPLSPHTRLKTLAILKSAFREAAALGLIGELPTTGIQNRAPSASRPKFLTWDQLKSADLGKYRTQIEFLALHGLRWGEAVVLSENDIRDGRIYINRSVHGETKSRSGVRTIPLISEFKPLPQSPKTLRKVLSPYGVHIHSLRHTYAYILKTEGVHVTTAQKLLGHSDVKVTLNIYTQVLDDEIDAVGTLLRSIY